MVETSINTLINNFLNLLTLSIIITNVSQLTKLCLPSGVEKHVKPSPAPTIEH